MTRKFDFHNGDGRLEFGIKLSYKFIPLGYITSSEHRGKTNIIFYAYPFPSIIGGGESFTNEDSFDTIKEKLSKKYAHLLTGELKVDAYVDLSGTYIYVNIGPVKIFKTSKIPADISWIFALLKEEKS
jgi:hypothetical protein